MDRLADFGIAVQPMVHVTELAAAIAFYEALGGRLEVGSRDGDWALLRLGDAHLSLLAHPPSEDAPGLVELHLTSSRPLEDIEAHLRSTAPDMIARGTCEEAFGRTLQLRMPDGLLVKLIEVERDLIE